MNNYGTMQEVESVLEESGTILGDIESILGSLGSIFSFVSFGFSTIILIISAIVVGIFSIAFYVFNSIPVYSLAKKVGLKYAWIAWVPLFHSYFRLFILCEVAGNKPFIPNISNFKIENRRMSFLAHILIKYFGGVVVTLIVTILSMFIPFIAPFSIILGLVPTAVCALIEYVYLRDVLDIFKEDKKSNNTTSLIITVIDTILIGDLIRTCYLYTLMKKQPLTQSEVFISTT